MIIFFWLLATGTLAAITVDSDFKFSKSPEIKAPTVSEQVVEERKKKW